MPPGQDGGSLILSPCTSRRLELGHLWRSRWTDHYAIRAKADLKGNSTFWKD